MRKEVSICVLLFVMVAVVFGQTLRHDFVNFDDGPYVYENPHVAGGLTVENAVWAFTGRHADNWHPLTWLSHMLDCQFYGLAPWGHHLTNVLLHAATAILLFLVLRRMTGDFWPSAFVAAVFAIHPLRVESVAWVAERKDVLSGLFFVLTLAAYAGYVRHPFSLARYLMVIALFALGLMAKPMLVTLPFVLLLLDYWPLGRMTIGATADQFAGWGGSSVSWGLVVEKLPLLALSAASVAATLSAQQDAVVANISLPLQVSIAGASYIAYLVQLFYPVGLAVFYPLVGLYLPAWKAVGCLLALVVISAGVVAWRRRHPYLLVGWLWYMGMLLPVSGLVQVGSQAMADRYTYLPQIGLCIALAWAVNYVTRSWPCRRWVCGVASVLVVATLMGCAWRQTCYWRNSQTLWARTLDCTGPNAMAYWRIGADLARHECVDEAITQYRNALEVEPDHAGAHNDLGTVLAAQGQSDEAIWHYRRALEAKPDYTEAHVNLGVVLANRGLDDDAARHYRTALEIDPDYAEAHNKLGELLLFGQQENHVEAIRHFRKATEIDPHNEDARQNLAIALGMQKASGRVTEKK